MQTKLERFLIAFLLFASFNGCYNLNPVAVVNNGFSNCGNGEKNPIYLKPNETIFKVIGPNKILFSGEVLFSENINAPMEVCIRHERIIF